VGGALTAVALLSVGFTAWAVRAVGLAWGNQVDPQTRVEALLTRLATDTEPVLAESRHVLLGQRSGGDPTCITQRLEDNRILLQGDPAGGAGLRLTAFYADAPDAPLALYSWSQEKLRPFLQAQRKANASALARAEKLAADARELASTVRSLSSRTDRGAVAVAKLVSVASSVGRRRPTQPFDETSRATAERFPQSPAWPAECLRRLEAAGASGDASAAQIWADELAAATFGLADLHRWLDVLLNSHLTSLDFQARCREAFVYADSVGTKDPAPQESSLPAAGLVVAWGQNYLEVEHQAEGLFRPPETAVASVTAEAPSDIPAARWMPPEVRPAFRWLRSRLSPTVQAVWDRAAQTPLDRSYLANMLFRAVSARALDSMALTLQRFEQSHPIVTQAELMDVLFYRSGFYSSGFHWADRYDARLLRAAGGLTGDQETVARRSQQVTNGLLKGWENYGSNLPTLTQSLDAGKLDCVSGTDMIGALYRDAGHGGYFVVRLRCGTAGHSVGAVPVEHDGKRQLLILDCLNPNPPSEVWPSAYFQDFTWPQGYPGMRGPFFCAELYVRGIDGYLFAAGYVVRGASAGQVVRAALPYLPLAPQPGSAKIFDGPYPPLPGGQAVQHLPDSGSTGYPAPNAKQIPNAGPPPEIPSSKRQISNKSQIPSTRFETNPKCPTSMT
jgi:hypothetical protein